MLNRKEKELKQREENRQYENGRLLKRLKECPNIAFKNYLKHHHIKTIAVYGAGAVGKELIKQLNPSIPVDYIIDKFEGGKKLGEIPILQLRFDFLPEVDAVIITPCHELEFIQFQLCNYYSNNCKFLALDALLDSIL